MESKSVACLLRSSLHLISINSDNDDRIGHLRIAT